MNFQRIKGSQNHHIVLPIDPFGKARDVYWVRAFKTGKPRLEESLKTFNLVEARFLRDKRLAEYLGTTFSARTKVYLVEDKFPEFLELKKNKAPSTLASMTIQWNKHLKPNFGGLLLDQVTESEWLSYVNLKKEDAPDRKFFNDRKYLSMFLNWCHREGFIAKLPKLEDVDPEIAEGRVYSKDEIKSLLDNANPDLWLQIQMALTMGMRVGEILSLEWAQVDWRKGTIHLPAAKTKIRKARTFKCSDLCFPLLKARHKESASAHIFPSPDDLAKPVGKWGNKTAWANCRANAKVAGKFHWLRHTFLTHAFKNAVNPALICKYAGLSIEEAQRTYLHFTVDDTAVVSELVRF